MLATGGDVEYAHLVWFAGETKEKLAASPSELFGSSRWIASFWKETESITHNALSVFHVADPVFDTAARVNVLCCPRRGFAKISGTSSCTSYATSAPSSNSAATTPGGNRCPIIPACSPRLENSTLMASPETLCPGIGCTSRALSDVCSEAFRPSTVIHACESPGSGALALVARVRIARRSREARDMRSEGRDHECAPADPGLRFPTKLREIREPDPARAAPSVRR
jgi:hypothetical protein